MTILYVFIAGVAIGIAIMSVPMIKKASQRPANGELKTLERLDRKILVNQKGLSKHFIGATMRVI